MINIQESVLRHNLKPRVESDLPGRLRILFPRYGLLPDSVRPYIHYVEDILMILPGVNNVRIGTVLVLYDQKVCTSAQILRWVDIAVDTGIEIAQEIELSDTREEKEIASLVRRRLALRIPQDIKARKQREGQNHAKA